MYETDAMQAGEVFTDGLSNVLAEPEFAESEDARRALKILEENPPAELSFADNIGTKNWRYSSLDWRRRNIGEFPQLFTRACQIRDARNRDRHNRSVRTDENAVQQKYPDRPVCCRTAQ